MVITGAFLAESAWVADNKLNVSGGVLSRFAVGPDRSARLVLVVLTQSEASDSDHRVDLEIRPPDDEEPQHMQLAVPDSALGQFPGFAFFEVEVSLPVDGRWVFLVTGSVGANSIPLLVMS